MSFNHHRIAIRQEGASRGSRTLFYLTLLVACAIIPAACFLIQHAINPSVGWLEDELRRVEAAIGENEDALEKLAVLERRLSSTDGDSRLYRLPVLVQGRSLYVTLDALAMEEVSQSLALDDLMTKRARKLPGDVRTGDPAKWNIALAEICRESKHHLTAVELPAIHRRMEEVRQDGVILESRRVYLQEKITRATH